MVLFTTLVGLTFLTERTTFDHPYRTLFDVQIFVLLLFPLLLAPLVYRCVTGNRSTNRIKLILGLPNERWEYIGGKLLSRFGLITVYDGT